MRILRLNAPRFFGGPERQILELSRVLPHEYTTIFRSFSEGGRCQAFIQEATRRGFDAKRLQSDMPRLWATLKELDREIERIHPDIVCCHGYKADLLGQRAARRHGLPVIAVAHGWTGESLKVQCYEQLDRHCLRKMDMVVSVSAAQEEKVAKAGVPKSCRMVIRNAVRTQRFSNSKQDARAALAKRLPSKSPDFLVGSAGRLSPEKGFDLLVEAAGQLVLEHPNIGFIHFGSGPLEHVIREKIAAQGLQDRFILTGFTENLDDLLPGFDLFVLPSYTEGLPNVVLEAMAAHVPVVATAVGGTPELIEDEKTGYLVQPGSSRVLAKRIHEVVSSPAELERIADNGRARVVAEFTFAAQSRRYQDLFQKLRPMQSSRPKTTQAQPVRVCYMIDDLGTGGTELQLLQLIRGLNRQETRPYLCLLNGSNLSSEMQDRIDCPFLALGVQNLARPATIGAMKRFADFLRRERIDVLQVHFPDSFYFGAPVARWAGVPVVLKTRRGLVYWKTLKHRLVGQPIDRLANWFLSDGVISNSRACKRIVELEERVPSNRIFIMENGLDLSRFNGPIDAIRSRLRATTSTPVIGTVSMLRSEKGLSDLVEAARYVVNVHPSAKIHIAGEGSIRHLLERQMRDLDLENNVQLVGRVDDIPRFLAELDVAVLPSHSEGSPNAVIEYMAAGLPIVATAVGGNLELIEHNVSGLLVPARRPDRLAEAILSLIEDRPRAIRFGRAAREEARQRFDLHLMVHRYEAFYRAVCNRRHDGRLEPKN